MTATTILASLLLSGLLLAGIYLLTSLGLALIFGVMDVVNFAHGGLIMAGGYISYWAFTTIGLDPLLSLMLVALALFFIGAAIQRLLVEHVIGDEELYSLLLTFGLLLVFEATFRIIFGTQNLSIEYLSRTIVVGSVSTSMTSIISGFIGFTVTAALFAFLNRSELGQAIRATSQAPDLAEACGINAPRIRATTFGIGSLLAGMGGVAYFLSYSVSPIGGRHLLLIAFIVIVLGGMGSIKGAAVAALIVALYQTFSAFYLGSHAALMTMFVGIAVLLLVKPHGLFGEPGDRLNE